MGKEDPNSTVITYHQNFIDGINCSSQGEDFTEQPGEYEDLSKKIKKNTEKTQNNGVECHRHREIEGSLNFTGNSRPINDDGFLDGVRTALNKNLPKGETFKV